MFNGRMAYKSDNADHGKYLYFRQGRWAVGDTLGGQIAWYWTDDAQLNAADVLQNLHAGDKDKNLADMKPNMFDEVRVQNIAKIIRKFLIYQISQNQNCENKRKICP